jgi:hypothetical protein
MKVLLLTAMALGFVLILGTTPQSEATAASQATDKGQINLVQHWYRDGWYGPRPYYYDPYYYRPLFRFGPIQIL